MEFNDCVQVVNQFLKRRESKETALIERLVGHYLLNVPICSGKVVAVSPRYGTNNYFCEIIADVAKLYPWAEHHASACWSSDRQAQAARLSLPIMLRGADLSDESPTYLPSAFSLVLEPYAPDLVTQGIAEVKCITCNATITDIRMKDFDKRKMMFWSYWTTEWHCPEGHLLRHEEHELKIACRR